MMRQPKVRDGKSRLGHQRPKLLRSSALAASAPPLGPPSAIAKPQLRPKSAARSPFSTVQCVGPMGDKIAKRRMITRANREGSGKSLLQLAAAEAAEAAAAEAASGNTKRRASRPTEGARNTTKLANSRLVDVRDIKVSAAGAHVGLAAGCRRRHMSAAGASLPAMPDSSANAISLGSNSQTTNAYANQHQHQQHPQQRPNDDMDMIKSASRAHSWHWNDRDRSHEVSLSAERLRKQINHYYKSDDKLEVCFHPQCSESAAAIRGSQPLLQNGNYYYWEVTVFDKAYGTSVMFGVCTKEQKLHANDYCNLVGLDKEGWSLSHKGLIWHNTKMSPYTDTFPANQTITLGILFNTMRGELSYFMNGKNLGVAFCGLNNVSSELYPVIGSTAKCTRMRLTGAYCGYVSLMERSCFTLLRNARDRIELVKNMHQYQVPKNLIRYLAEAAEVCGSQTETTAQLDQYQLEC